MTWEERREKYGCRRESGRGNLVDEMDRRRGKIMPCIDEGYIGRNSAVHSRAGKVSAASRQQNYTEQHSEENKFAQN